uniref:LRRCT domain-containing protein n=1 Tax=Oryzias melastigma TaxID=30732 RepID=A0A3B3C9W3_ORYME
MFFPIYFLTFTSQMLLLSAATLLLILTLSSPIKVGKCPKDCSCDGAKLSAVCVGHTKVPRGFPAKTQLLDLRGNHFHYIPALSFPGTVQVVSLHLESCRIREIEGGAFQGMNHLLYLYLSDNNLTLLDPKIFAGIQNLTYLHLEGNQLTQFPGSALSLVPNLFVLHLERNNISKLEPSGLLSSVTPTLRELYLSNNSISVITRGALSSASIGSLYLDSNQLIEVPTSALTGAPNLEELSLSQNPILRVERKAFQRFRLSNIIFCPNCLSDLNVLILQLISDRLVNNPLLCSCALLPLRRWMETVRFEVSATCGNPPDLRGQQVRDADVFTSCLENASMNQKGS